MAASSPLFLRMPPPIWRDLPCLRQLDHVHRRRMAAFAAGAAFQCLERIGAEGVVRRSSTTSGGGLRLPASTDRVVGCHIVGDTAAEIIQAVAIAVKMKATKADFDSTFALHPTAAEELVTMRTPTARYVREAAAE
jgi:hypothetical protein